MQLITIGKISKPQGIRGELKVIPLTDDPERFVSLRQVRIAGKEYTVTRARVDRDQVYLTLQGVADRNAAELLRNLDVQVPRDQAVKPAAGRYLIADIIGCEAVTDNGQAVGNVCDVLQYGAADVWVIRTKQGKNLMIPCIGELVLDVDTDARIVRLHAGKLNDLAVYED